jgi:hypothetical protein
MEKLTIEQRNEIVRRAITAADLMTEINFELMPVALLNGDCLDWLDESGMREKWARLLESKNMILPQFNDYARVAVIHGLMVLEGKNTGTIGGVEELLKPIDFEERVKQFMQAQQQAVL